MRKVLFIICPNGLGHLIRSIYIINNLKNYNFTICCSTSHQKIILDQKLIRKNIKIFTYLNSQNLKKNLAKISTWDKNLKKKFLDRFDKIVSDNLVSKLFDGRNVLLISNFLWSEINKNLISKYRRIEKKFISNQKNILLTNKCFSSINIKKKNIKKIDFTFKQYQVSKKKIQDRFLSKKILLHISNNDLEFIDFNFFHKKGYKFFSFRKLEEKKIKKFNNNFSNISFIICNLGMGSIFDAIQYKIPLLILKKNYDYDFELKNNLKLVRYYNICFDVEDIKKYKMHNYIHLISNFNKFKFAGLEQFNKYLSK